MSKIDTAKMRMVHSVLSFKGGSPYPGKNARELIPLLEKGYRMPRPKHVSEEL